MRLLALAAALLAPIPAIQAGELVRMQTGQRVVALTFDGGSDAIAAPGVLRILRRERAPATFFLTGRWVERYPQLARALARRYPIANHTWDHSALPTLADREVRSEILRAARAIRAVSGRDPRPLFRFPYGARDARTLRIVHALGYVSIRWTVDTLGWLGVTPAVATQRVIDHLQPGEIVLLHLGDPTDARALTGIIRAVRARGYQLVTLSGVHLPR